MCRSKVRPVECVNYALFSEPLNESVSHSSALQSPTGAKCHRVRGSSDSNESSQTSAAHRGNRQMSDRLQRETIETRIQKWLRNVGS